MDDLRHIAQTLTIDIMPKAPAVEPVRDRLVELLEAVSTATPETASTVALALGEQLIACTNVLQQVKGPDRTVAKVQHQIRLTSFAVYALSADFKSILVKAGVRKADAAPAAANGAKSKPASGDTNDAKTVGPPASSKTSAAPPKAVPKESADAAATAATPGDDETGFSVDQFVDGLPTGLATGDDLGFADDGGSTVTVEDAKAARAAAGK